ncbi:hypothetical protein KKG81_07480 [bacterium]|jgi:uncharacterized protein (DUF302 family)|nr:hypothetical protein [bacterium]
MKKSFLLILFLCSFLKANYEIIENENLFLVKTLNNSFQENLLNLKDEINFQGFTIVYELNLAKATNELASLLEKKEILQEGINLGICKSSFTLQMLEENFNNINYCPLAISIYKKNNQNYISYKFYKPFKKDEQIANKINETLKNLIIKSVE